MGKKILITGAAGFIGFHLAAKLRQQNWEVIGIDNFNDYYDPLLKKARASELKKMGIEVLTMDLLDFPSLQKLFREQPFSHVAHLAAQAGVRYCFENPDSYIDTNLKGFTHILEAAKDTHLSRFLYASSSSVYGKSLKIPTDEDSETAKPINLYGATKKANEVMAYSYHYAYSIPMIGLRFFTVYGPWGRPDMAMYKFTKKIKENQPIELYNLGKMKRDFTYVDDAVAGCLKALEYEGDFDIFNIGNNQPVGLFDLVHELEHYLGKKAICELKPLQPGESAESHADISKAKTLLHYSPKISLKEGLRKFIDWYDQYHSFAKA